MAECAPAAGAARGQTAQYPPPYPRPGTTPVFENDVIAVWDVSWLKQKYPLHTHRYDLIGVSYVEGDRIITQGDAPGRLSNTKAWVFQANVAGNTHVEEGASDPPMRAILMEVKTPAPGADVEETADGLHQVARRAVVEEQAVGRVGDPAGHNGAAASPPQERCRTDLRCLDTGADAEGCFVPAGTVHDGPAPEPGGRVFIFEIK